MLQLKKIFVIFFLSLSLGSCERSQVKDVYYVKYEVESSYSLTGGRLNVDISNENGNLLLVIYPTSPLKQRLAQWERVLKHF